MPFNHAFDETVSIFTFGSDDGERIVADVVGRFEYDSDGWCGWVPASVALAVGGFYWIVTAANKRGKIQVMGANAEAIRFAGCGAAPFPLY